MRIGLDCRLGGHAHAGIGRYISNLAARLPAAKPEWEWVYICSSRSQANEMLSELSGIEGSKVEILIAPFRHYTLAEQRKLPPMLSQANLDLLHVPHFNIPVFYHGALVVTIHDLLWHERRGRGATTLSAWQYWFKYLGYQWIVKQATKRAGIIFVPAETVKKTVARYYPQTKNKIIVTKEGVDKDLVKKVKTKNDTSKNNRAYLLYVGSLYPHKNIKVVLEALQQMPDLELRLVGSRDIFTKQTEAFAQKLNVASQVKFLGYVSDTKLQQLYRGAVALVQPSFSEGFGLTGVEAMAIGVPVLASNIPIFKEIYQDAALFFDPQKPEAVVSAVIQLDASTKNRLIKAGHYLAQQYDWNTMVEQTVRGYETALESN